MAAGLLALALFGCSPSVPAPPQEIPPPQPPPGLARARQLLGPARSGSAWHSGVWPGGDTITASRSEAFGTWRGAPTDAVLTYPEISTWQQIHDSRWHIETYRSHRGVLVYGLPMLPSEDDGDFASIVRGDHDWVYAQVARDLLAEGRGRAIVRIGWEANGDWFPWNTTAARADEYIAAFRHIAGVLRGIAPDLVIDFDVACGTRLRGQQDRTDALTRLYPGDDVVDLIGCDIYDWYHTQGTDEQSWQRSVRPAHSVGIADVAEFARAHGKGLTFPEWGLASTDESGAGDNPYFVVRMRRFFEQHAEILTLESYFNEPATSLANSIWSPVQMPQASAVYRRLW